MLPRDSRDHLPSIYRLSCPDGAGRLAMGEAMFYSVRHLTKFRYAEPVTESVMETRMHPRTDSSQRCLSFHLSVSPRCRLFTYRDYLGNHIHHFDIPTAHQQLVIVAESLVEAQSAPEIPAGMAPETWDQLDEMVKDEDCWEML